MLWGGADLGLLWHPWCPLREPVLGAGGAREESQEQLPCESGTGKGVCNNLEKFLRPALWHIKLSHALWYWHPV